jgi:succinyl-diaminopimelate desuccinylase
MSAEFFLWGEGACGAAVRFSVEDPDAWEKEAANHHIPILWTAQDASWGRFVVVGDPDGRPVISQNESANVSCGLLDQSRITTSSRRLLALCCFGARPRQNLSSMRQQPHSARRRAGYARQRRRKVTLETDTLKRRFQQRLSEPAMVELTKRLISIASENPPGNQYEESAYTLVDELKKLGFKDVRLEGACILASAGSGSRTLYFSGHYDVVPAQSRAQFRPHVEGTNLFGRGSSDMKSGLAAMIHAAAAVHDEGLLGQGRIGIVLVPDEETAGPRGSRELAARGLLGLDGIGMLTPEPTGGVIWNANRGAISLRATVRGKAAHVGRQFEGVNAFERALPAIARLAEIKKEVELRETQQNIAPAAARKSILMLGGQVEAGTNFNVTPEFCSFTIDRRLNPEERLEEEKRRLQDALEHFEIEVLQEEPAAATPAGGPLGITLSRHIESVTGKEAVFEMCPGLLETRFYAARGIPAFAYGPGLLTVSHGPNEFVPIRNIAQCALIYALTAAEMLR